MQVFFYFFFYIYKCLYIWYSFLWSFTYCYV